MLADIVEASSRMLDDPTPNRLQQHINNVVKGLFTSGQFDETDLTLKDLNRLSKSFLHVLVGLFHHKIKYPEKTPEKPCDAKPVTEKNGVVRQYPEKIERRLETDPPAENSGQTGGEEDDRYAAPPQ
jgi:hypothetical protein